MTYYKYRGDSEFTEQIFTSGQIYLSTAEGLNDPFECSLEEMGKEWIEEQILKMKQAGIAGFIMAAKTSMDNNEDFFGLSNSEINPMLETIKNLKGIDEVAAFRKQFMTKHTGHPPANPETFFSRIDVQLLSVGIFSMSANSSHPLMWAHYAGEHTGICLGFNKSPNSKLANPEHFLPVIYSDNLPEMAKEGFNVQMNFSLDNNGSLYTSSYKISFTDKTFQKAITTKSTHWNSEEEWRYIEPYSGLYDWPGPLTEIIFGLR